MSDGEDQPRDEPSAEIPTELIAFYQARAQELLDVHSRLFDEFTRTEPELVHLGDAKLRSAQATSYNILLDAAAMPLDTNEQLIFYNNYIGRPEHFGTLLAAMEHAGLITEGEIRLGVKASKVVNTGAWQPETSDETVESHRSHPDRNSPENPRGNPRRHDNALPPDSSFGKYGLSVVYDFVGVEPLCWSVYEAVTVTANPKASKRRT
jgi:hypothetical protein